MLKIAKIAVNIAFICAIIAYPFVFWAGSASVDDLRIAENKGSASGLITAQVAIFLIVLFALSVLKYIFSRDKLTLISVIFFGLLIVLRLGIGGGFLDISAYFYPAVVNLAFLAFFAMSLRGESIITKFAKMQNPALDLRGVAYTRKLTKIWCALFIFNALISFALALLEDKIYWSVFCGIVAYCLVGALFAGEILYRKFIFKRRFAQNGAV